MKYRTLSCLLAFTSLAASAQTDRTATNDGFSTGSKPVFASLSKHAVFTDAGISFSTSLPGISATYNYKLSPRLGVGVGAQAYYLTERSIGSNIGNRLTPAIYADVRGYYGRKKSIFLLFADVGMNLYKYRSTSGNIRRNNNSLYTGLGMAYHYRTSQRGAGPYVSLKMVYDAYITHEHYSVGPESKVMNIDATMVASAGFKF
jgi:hypothetical protein